VAVEIDIQFLELLDIQNINHHGYSGRMGIVPNLALR